MCSTWWGAGVRPRGSQKKRRHGMCCCCQKTSFTSMPEVSMRKERLEYIWGRQITLVGCNQFEGHVLSILEQLQCRLLCFKPEASSAHPLCFILSAIKPDSLYRLVIRKFIMQQLTLRTYSKQHYIQFSCAVN